jgi:hypothetical protein
VRGGGGRRNSKLTVGGLGLFFGLKSKEQSKQHKHNLLKLKLLLLTACRNAWEKCQV